jgi:hypothetical protein
MLANKLRKTGNIIFVKPKIGLSEKEKLRLLKIAIRDAQNNTLLDNPRSKGKEVKTKLLEYRAILIKRKTKGS